jgi:hypothetical protein
MAPEMARQAERMGETPETFGAHGASEVKQGGESLADGTRVLVTD